MSIVTINDTELTVREWKNQRVVTFKDIDEVHKRPEGTARDRFNDNRNKFIEGEDYFIIAKKDFNIEEGAESSNSLKGEIHPSSKQGVSEDVVKIEDVNTNGTTFLTETGYLMLIKSFNDDLAWEVQRKLVNTYFKTKEIFDTNLFVKKDDLDEFLRKYDELIHQYDLIKKDYNHLLDQSSRWNKYDDRIYYLEQIAADVIEPPTEWETKMTELLHKYKDNTVYGKRWNTSDEIMLNMLIQNLNIDMDYYEDRYIKETRKKHPTKLCVIGYFKTIRTEFENLLNYLYKESKKTYDPEEFAWMLEE